MVKNLQKWDFKPPEMFFFKFQLRFGMNEQPKCLFKRCKCAIFQYFKHWPSGRSLKVLCRAVVCD